MHKQRSVEATFQQHTDKAVKVLTDIIKSSDASPAVKLNAAREILDRGYGKSVDRVAVASLTGNSGKPLEELSTQELLAILDEPDPVLESESTVLSIVPDE